MNIKESFKKLIETSNRLTLAYQLENPSDWPAFEAQQSRAHLWAERMLSLGLGLLVMSLGIDLLYIGEGPQSVGLFLTGCFLIGTVAPLVVLSRAVREPLLELMGWQNLLTVYRGLHCARLSAAHHKTSFANEISNAWQVDARALTTEYKNQLLQGHSEVIVQSAFKHHDKALLTAALNYLDIQKAGGALRGVTAWRRPINPNNPGALNEDEPFVVYHQNLHRNDDVGAVGRQDAVSLHYYISKPTLIRAASQIAQLPAFEAVSVPIRNIGLTDPLNAIILAYCNFHKNSPSLSFTEQEANMLLEQAKSLTSMSSTNATL